MRALNDCGEELAEFYGSTETEAREMAVQWVVDEGTKSKVVWVDDPEDHPVLSPLLEAEENFGPPDGPGDAPERSSAGPAYPREDLELMRSQHHICGCCLNRPVCATAQLTMFEEQLLTITGCRSFRPEEAVDAPVPRDEVSSHVKG